VAVFTRIIGSEILLGPCCWFVLSAGADESDFPADTSSVETVGVTSTSGGLSVGAGESAFPAGVYNACRPLSVTGAGAGPRGQCRLAACPGVPQGALPVSGMPWGSDLP
jgi:hypothetical protein